MTSRLWAHRLSWLGVPISVTVGIGTVVSLSAIAGLTALAVIALVPELSVVGLFVGVEEQLGSGGATAASAPIVGLGSGLYRLQLAGLSAPILVVLLAAAVSVVRRGFAVGGLRLWLFTNGAMALWTIGLALYEGASLRLASTAATPWVLLGAASVVGRNIGGSGRRARQVTIAIVVLLSFKAAVAIIALKGAVGLSGIANGERIFYDSALPAIAGAALVAALLFRRFGAPVPLLTLIVSVVVTVLSFRRNVWVAGVAAIAIVPVLARSWVTARRVAVVALLVVVAGGVFAPTVIGQVDTSTRTAIATLAGRGNDQSVQGHLLDWRVGSDLIRSHEALGIGVLAKQPVGLADTDLGRLYVHNEWLETWLRFGVIGCMGLTILVVNGLVLSWRVLISRDLRGRPLIAGAAAFLLMLPLTLLFFPNLTTTTRWPMLCGLAIGLASCATVAGDPIEDDRPTG